MNLEERILHYGGYPHIKVTELIVMSQCETRNPRDKSKEHETKVKDYEDKISSLENNLLSIEKDRTAEYEEIQHERDVLDEEKIDFFSAAGKLLKSPKFNSFHEVINEIQ